MLPPPSLVCPALPRAAAVAAIGLEGERCSDADPAAAAAATWAESATGFDGDGCANPAGAVSFAAASGPPAQQCLQRF